MMKSSLFSIAFILLIDALSLVSAGSNEASKVWLAENAKKEGVTTLPSGLQYKVLTKGTGDSHPTIETPCLCHYEGTLTDGTVFDSSYNRNKPSTFAPNQVIKGWTEAMQLMVEGEKWELYIPSDLAYGKSGSPPHIKSGDALIFKIEILEIKGDTAPASMCELSNIAHCSAEEKAYIKTAHKTYGGYSDMIEAQIRMIQNWDGTESEENIAWGIRRINILKQLLLVAEDNEDL
mmetsp:Transcript_35499/g.42378  ORF Transcript_35499/g.42378 Transcript_35499/m.42378 type:complete len:234 (+) Transcript_35499:21-722(+)